MTALFILLTAGCNDVALRVSNRPYTISWDIADSAATVDIPQAQHERLSAETNGCELSQMVFGRGLDPDGRDVAWQLPETSATLLPDPGDRWPFYVETSEGHYVLSEGDVIFDADGDDVTWSIAGQFCHVDDGTCEAGTATVSTFIMSNDQVAAHAPDTSRPGPWRAEGDVLCEPVR